MVQSVNQADILIAGGSFAGLALALALSQQSGGDLRITVVSPDFPPIAPETINVRASALSRGSLHLLNHLGLWRDLQAVAEPVTSIELTDSGLDDALRPARLTYHLQPPGTAPQEPPNMVIIENHNLGRALHQAAKGAPGVTLHAGASRSGSQESHEGDATETSCRWRSIHGPPTMSLEE